MFSKKIIMLLKRYELNHLFGYFFIGGTAAIVDWMIFAVLVFIININFLVAACISFFFSTYVNYVISIRRIFQSEIKFKKNKEISLVFFVSGIGLIFNLAFLTIFVSYISLNIMLSKILATGLTFLWNFGSRKYYIFKSSI
jgi:putative flippase GtrA